MPLIPTQEPPYYEISTGPGPAGTKYYTALITQSAMDAPVATILQNTLTGIPVWTRSGVGSYILTLAGEFPIAKTITPPFDNGGLINIPIGGVTASANYYNILNGLDDDTLYLSVYENNFTPTELSSIIATSQLLIQIIIYP